MLCPQCNCTFDEAVTDTCPKCQLRAGTSMYLDGAVKIDDNSIIVDEHGAEAGPAPQGRPPYPHKERRRRPRPTAEVQSKKKRPAGGAKSLAVSVSLGALLLAGSIGAGLYYLKYRIPQNAAEHIAPRPLVLPSPAAPEPTYKDPEKVQPPDTVAAEAEEPGQENQQEGPEEQALEPPETPAETPPAPAATPAVTESKAPAAASRKAEAKPAVASKPAPAPSARDAMRSGSYHLLCGSFKSRQKALAATAKLKRSRYPAFVERADLGARGIWYRIKVGGFSSRQEAARARDAIKTNLNFEALVRKNR